MPILNGDIKMLASKVMADVPEGGGGPSGTVIADGASNTIFPDVYEADRAGGVVNVRQLFVSVQTADHDTYGGANIIVAEPPADPNVSITLAKTTFFARRTDIANAIANYLIRGPVWGGYLFENHVIDQRQIQLFQRPGTPTPPIGRTLCLILNEGLAGEKEQYIRMTRVESEIRMFYDPGTGKDFAAQVVTCDLSDRLRYAFPGSPPSISFAMAAGKTLTRDTTVADASNFFGVVPLSAAVAFTDSVVKVASIYTQLVPSSRTESIALDQKPAAQRSFILATSPRSIEVGLTPHSMRIRVGQENRGFSWVQMLRPRPAPNTIVVSYRAQGNWYTVQDDGLGALSGSGVGTVNYVTGSIALTLPSMPDAGSAIIFSWGENTAYTSRAGQAGFRAPEFAWALPQQGLKPGSVAVHWLSGGEMMTLIDNGTGGLTGSGSGEVNYASGKLFVRPSAMIDAGGEFSTDYTYTSMTTQNVAAPALDAAGFATIALDAVPAPRSVTVKWITVRNVSANSGSSEITTTQTTGVETVTVHTPVTQYGVRSSSGAGTVLAGGTVTMTYVAPASAPLGTYTYEIQNGGNVNGNSFLSGLLVGSFTVSESSPGGDRTGSFELALAPGAPTGDFSVAVYDPTLGRVGASPRINISEFPGRLTDIPANMPQSGIKIRNPLSSGQQTSNSTGATLVAGMYTGGVLAGGQIISVAVFAIHSDTYGWHYDPPAQPDALWSQAEYDAKAKTMLSLNGTSTAYQLWGSTGFAPVQQVQYASS